MSHWMLWAQHIFVLAMLEHKKNLSGKHLESGGPGHREVANVGTIRVSSNHLQQCPPRGLAWEELSRSGHLGTSYWPECPAPHPHRFSSFLPFSFLINHTLLPNLNMEIPRLRLCNYS